MKNKTIIALYGRQNSGKSTILKMLPELLKVKYPNHKLILPIPKDQPKNWDIVFAIDVDGIKVGVASQGDTGGHVEKNVGRLIGEFKCDIIFCATRTRGGSVTTVQKLARENQYEIIWTAPYEPSNDNIEESLNSMKAKHLLELVRELGLIK